MTSLEKELRGRIEVRLHADGACGWYASAQCYFGDEPGQCYTSPRRATVRAVRIEAESVVKVLKARLAELTTSFDVLIVWAGEWNPRA